DHGGARRPDRRHGDRDVPADLQDRPSGLALFPSRTWAKGLRPGRNPFLFDPMSDILKAAAHPTVFPWLCLVLGLVVGSFLNVVIHRLPKMMERGWQEECADLRGEAIAPAERFNLFVPRSRCPACGHTVAAAEKIPLVSLMMLRGRSTACKARISPRYPLVELLGGAGAAWSAAHFGFSAAAFAAMVFLWCIVAASFIDFDSQLLPDSITLPLLWL